ncbi:MAG: hypothetical protein HWE18_12700 [Gammaproteobacteria bacterium]|nr:hypothetical protein [Gammaproteobacteria bacterium]
MKYRYVLLIAIVSLVSGGMLGGLAMQSEIDAANSKVDRVNQDLFLKAENHLIESNRFGLEAELKLIRTALDLDIKGAPRKYIGEQYINVLSVRIDDLNRYKSSMANDDSRNGVDKSIEEARKLIQEIEFSYL